ncbi:hypothetical protein [Methylocaldum sp.]|uniref:hypothetical protein n=1 Tax=Methylocaldum sp. TaxID=1969727 RepID=UPI002D5E88B5|nr:hypothetical protein [Methylocaldum sp.]HYE36997.1 hypothetical protein [Methylocaldum sp.]
MLKIGLSVIDQLASDILELAQNGRPSFGGRLATLKSTAQTTRFMGDARFRRL